MLPQYSLSHNVHLNFLPLACCMGRDLVLRFRMKFDDLQRPSQVKYSIRHFILHSVIGVLLSITLLRFVCYFIPLLIGYRPVDFMTQINVSQAILQGINIFAIKSLAPPVGFPGYAVIFYPFSLVDRYTASSIYLAINILLGTSYFSLIFRNSNISKTLNFKYPNKYTLLIVICFFLFFNSSPFVECMQMGQSSIIISLCLVMTILYKNKYINVLLLALAATLKFTMLPFWGILLLTRKYYKLCVFAFLLFVALALTPILFGCNIMELYHSYIIAIIKSMTSVHGSNSFLYNSYNTLQFDFLKNSYLSISIKVLLGFLGVFFVIKNKKQKEFDVALLLLIGCVTMIIVYHRLYDLVFAVPFLLLIGLFFCENRQWSNLLITSCFAFFLLIPMPIVLYIASLFGSYIGNNGVVEFTRCPHFNLKNIFPIYQTMMFLLTLYSIYLVFYFNRTKKALFIKCSKQISTR